MTADVRIVAQVAQLLVPPMRAHIQNKPEMRHLRHFGNDPHLRKPVGQAAVNAAKTECCRGHPLTDSKVYRWIDRRGFAHRSCRTCKRLREGSRVVEI